MSDYQKQINFTAKDFLPPGHPDKIIFGADLDSELLGVQEAVETKTDKIPGVNPSNIPVFNPKGNLEDSGLNIQALYNIFIPVGSIQIHAQNSMPGDYGEWMPCNGQALSRTEYAELYQQIGTSFGPGNGTSTFNLPDFRGRVPIGTGNSSAPDGQNRSRGDSGGRETVELTLAQMPRHNHGEAGSHSHTQRGGSGITGASGPGTTVLKSGSSSTAPAGAHTHQSQGNNEAHPNMQPYLTTPFSIRVR